MEPGLVENVAEVLRRHLGRWAERLVAIPTYTDTVVYEAQLADRSVIFKAADPKGRDPSRIGLEAWACARVRGIGVPAPSVVAVDTSATLFPSPYLIMQKMVGRPLTQLGLPLEQQRPYLQQAGHYLRLIHAIEMEGYGRLDEDLYLQTGQVRGEADTWHATVLRGVGRGLDYLGRHHLLDTATIDTIHRLVRHHDAVLSAWTSSCLLHGDLGAVHVYVDVEREAVTGLIDFADRSAGDPLWDLTAYEWSGGDDLLYLLEGYEPDVAMRAALDVKFQLYCVLQAVPWAQWCHERGYLQAIDVLAHVVRRAQERLEIS